MRALRETHARLVGAVGGNGGGYVAGDLGAVRSELEALVSAANACLERLEQLGVLVKDADAGLVDFPARRRGRPVLLCWRVGEDSVAWWHDETAGFAGRKPVDWDE
jgi:hypothetical protein